MSENADVKLILDELARNWVKLQENAYYAVAINAIVCLPIMPNWIESPDNAMYCVTNANQLQYWTDTLPSLLYGATGFEQTGNMMEFYRQVTLPFGVDWRLCVWKRSAQ